MNFEEIVQKTVNAKVKASLRSSIIVQDSDVRCPKGHCLSHNTSFKVKTQGSNHKNLPRSKESKSKDPKSAPPRDNMMELAKKVGEKKSLKGTSENALGSRKNSPRTLARPQRRKKRGVTLVRLYISSAIRKATMPAIAPSQKTSVGFNNLYAGDW